MATSSEQAALPRIWNDPAEVMTEWPSKFSPKRLKVFCDTMVHSFRYEGNFFPAAVFRCDTKVTAWGIECVESNDNKVFICPKLRYQERVHPKTGLNVVDMQGLDHSTALLIVDEVIPKSEESIRYGLILDYSKMDMDLCETITEQGMLNKGDNTDFWSPSEIKDEWDIIDEQRQAKAAPTAAAAVSPAKPSPMKKTMKRKSIVGAPGDKEYKEGSQKKRKVKSTPLTIQKAVNMTDIEINKLNATEMKAMHKLYQDVFMPLYKWEKKPLATPDGRLLRVHYKYLHKDVLGRLVYRGIEQSRLKKIKNRILVDANYNSENRYITVYPLKVGPHGPDNTIKYWDKCPKRESLTATTHYYIIGGQHTVEAHKLLVESGDIPERDKAWASTFNVIPIWQKFDLKNNDVVHLSKALNQNIVGEQKEQNFTKQLLHCRQKWKDVGSPMPSLYGRGHSAEFSAFSPIVSTIFTGVKGSDAADLKIPLLFMTNDEDVERWIKIEELFLTGGLPDGLGHNSKAKRKPFAKNDFKPLYGFRTEDINYLAGLVENGSVCMKNPKPGATWSGQPLVSLKDAGARERQIRAMKNELMNFYRQHPLPSKQPDYVAYTAAQWDLFADEKKISRDDLELWVDKSLATELGKEWLAGRLQGLNKTSDPNDCPEAVKSMWRSFMNVHAQEAVEAVAVRDFEMQYCCHQMDETTWDISSILADNVVKSWRGLGKTHVYFWFMFEITSAGAQAKLLENHKLKRLFDALEYKDSTSSVVRARSPAVVITNAEGFYAMLCHLQKRFEQTRRRVWDWHVVNYIPDGCDGFPKPITGSNYNVFIIFLFEHDDQNGATAAFYSFFPGLQNLKAVYMSSEMEDMETCFRRRPRPWFKITSALNIFGPLTFKDMVLVNVNGAAEFTFLGIWAGYKVLEVVDSEDALTTTSTIARQIWDQFCCQHRQSDEEEDAEDPLQIDAGIEEDEGNAEEAVETADEDEEREDEEEEDDDDDDASEGALGDKGTTKGIVTIDSSETEDDLPPSRPTPRSDDQFGVVPRQASVPAIANVGKGRGERVRRPRDKGTAASASKSSVGIGRSPDTRRERRTKRNLDFPENDFDFSIPASAAKVQQRGHAVDIRTSSVLEGTSGPPLQSPSPSTTAQESVMISEVGHRNRTVKLVGVPSEGAAEEQYHPEELTEDPYSLETMSGAVGSRNSTGMSSGDLQMSKRKDGLISVDASGLRREEDLPDSRAEVSDFSGDVLKPSEHPGVALEEATVTLRDGGDSGVAVEEATVTLRDGEHPVADANVAPKATGLNDQDIGRSEGCESTGALPMCAETDPSPLMSIDASQPVKTGDSTGDLQMPGEFQATSAVDMSENVLQDTLLDLNPMSPEAQSAKVNPFSAQPLHRFTRAQVLENREKYEMFLTCPKIVYNDKGKETRPSKIRRNVWKANQFIYSSLFELPPDDDTQAQEEEEMRRPDVEGDKGSENPALTLSREDGEVPSQKYTGPSSCGP